MSLDLPRVIGHRGAAAHAPENTLAGLRRAHELGCAWAEVDIRLTVDRVPVLLHDATLHRTTTGSGRVATRSAAQIAGLDAGAWFGREFAGEPVPTLDAALAEAARLGLGLNLELKSEAGGRDAASALTLAVAGAVARSWPRAAPKPLLSSFEREVVEAAARAVPTLPRALLCRNIDDNAIETATRLGCEAIGFDQRKATPNAVAAIRRTGLAALGYTVNDRTRAGVLFGWGATSVFSDRPETVLAAL